MPLISAIIPTYRRADLLIERALPSVFAQTMWPEQEVIVVGDGTDQATVDAVTEMQRHHEELKFWNLPHYDYPEDFNIRWGMVGIPAINFGIEQAQGDWIAVLADDDEWLPNHHQVLIDAANRTGADHVYGIAETYKDGTKISQKYGAWPPGDAQLCNGANLWRRSLGYRFDPESNYRGKTSDADMWERMFAEGVKFHFERQVVLRYHRNWPVIPALIVPTLNQNPDPMLWSIDHPIERVVVIDNGDRDLGIRVEDTYNVIHLPHNIGVAASWNLGIKVTPLAPYWLIVNDDITFGAGDLDRLEETVDPRAAGIWFMLGMAAFAITRHTLNAVGWFDEEISHPAYNEDVDYCRRIDLAGLPRHEVGFTGTHVGSATIMADPVLRARNGETHSANDRHYAAKWGGMKLGGETFSTPYGRGGHLGDWKPDIEVLRSQAWPKR